MPKIEIKSSGRNLDISSILKTNEEVYENTPKEKKEKTQKRTLEEKKELKKEARYYLPVLYLNDQTQWDSKPLSERKHFTDEVAKNTCLGNCCGHEGLRAGCCNLDPNDLEHVLGPIDEEWIKKTVKWFKTKGINIGRHDLVIDFEEGKLIGSTFFDSHPVFDSPDSYPMLRIQANGVRFACKFLNVSNGMCTIYEQRPDMCRDYLCSYVKANFLVRVKETPNIYRKII
jgi:Fe-S-cluster containining protein